MFLFSRTGFLDSCSHHALRTIHVQRYETRSPTPPSTPLQLHVQCNIPCRIPELFLKNSLVQAHQSSNSRTRYHANIAARNALVDLGDGEVLEETQEIEMFRED
jgi:hypothetical protein